MIKCASGFTYDQIIKGESNNTDILDDTMTSSACEDICWNYHDDATTNANVDSVNFLQ